MNIKTNNNDCFVRRNNGKCREVWAGFLCECEDAFAGPTCDEEVGQPWMFHGHGMLSFNPLLRPIQLPWLTALSLRTREQHAFVMSVQIGQNSSVLLEIRDGKLVVSLDGADVIGTTNYVADGEWHRLEILWQSGHVSLDIDYRDRPTTLPLPAKLQGLYVGRILVGGPDQTIDSQLKPLYGCLQNIRVGSNQSLLHRPTVKENISIGCPSKSKCEINCDPDTTTCLSRWQSSECVCSAGYVGPKCLPVCDLHPCKQTGECLKDVITSKRGYRCDCTSSEYTGNYCDIKADQPCPATWWGTPVCGPCHCDETKGYDPACNKTTGECYCKENHYQPTGRKECIPCECYATGSFGPRCDSETGQCRCRTGVIGRACTDCPNPYAEVRRIYSDVIKLYFNELYNIFQIKFSH